MPEPFELEACALVVLVVVVAVVLAVVGRNQAMSLPRLGARAMGLVAARVSHTWYLALVWAGTVAPAR